MENEIRRTRSNQPLVFVSVTSILVLSILVWTGWNRYDGFLSHHLTLAQTTVDNAAQEIGLYLRDVDSSLALFAAQEEEQIVALAEDKSLSELADAFWLRVQLHFPDALTYVVTDDNGILLFSKQGEILDEKRQFDIKLFAKGRQSPIVIRSSSTGYRYEIMVPWYSNRVRLGVFSVAFDCGNICRTIANRQPAGHRLILQPIGTELAPDLPYRLDPSRGWTHVAAAIPGTKWRLVGQLDRGLQTRKLAEIGFEGVTLFGVFLAASFILHLRARRQDQALDRSEQRFLDLIETSEDLIWSVDRSGALISINDKAQEILGFPPEELIGRSFIEMSANDDLQRNMEVFRSVLEGNPCRQHVTRQLNAEGEEVYLNFNAVPIRNNEGRIVGASGTATNITEQVRSLKELQEKEQRYRQMFELNRAVKLIIDADSGKIIEANGAAMDFYGYSRDKLQSLNITDLNGLSNEEMRQRLDLAKSDRQNCFSARHLLASGETRDVEVRTGPVKSDGRILLYLIINDVTDRIRSEHALRHSEKKFRAIVDAATEGVIMADDRGIIELFNPAAQMMFGYLAEDAVGQSINMLVPDPFQPESDRYLAQILANGGLETTGSGSREFIARRKNGEEFPVRVSLGKVELDGRQHFVGLLQDISEVHQNEKRLAYLARNDVLTGLVNRREFEHRLDVILSLSEAPDEQHTLCYIDVDQLKVINDSCSHLAGDQLLKQLAIIIKSQLKESEIIGRIGGDEFGALLTNCSVERAEQICDNLLQTIRNFLFTWQDMSFNVGVSIGLAGFSPHGDSASGVLSAADIACQMAKSQGRSRLHVYHSGDSELIRHHGDMRLVSRINQALDEGRFHLHLQPISSVGDEPIKPDHYEVLVRMIDESGDLVIPEQFVPAAERYILMPAIDRWVISRLFSLQGKNLRRWAKANPQTRDFLFAVNLSGTSLTDDGFLSYLKRQFQEWKIPYRAICFEITETAAIANLGRAQNLIDELKTLGSSFALDDFGTGLSSYTYLKDIPVDYLKIDGSFVRNMADDPVDYAMVESINQIGHILGLKTIAEWAEDSVTLNQLRALNVDFAQGFGVGQPQPLEEFTYKDRG